MSTEMALRVRSSDKAIFVKIPTDTIQDGLRLESLLHLVASVPDSLPFKREGNQVTFIEKHFDDVPWFCEIGEIIQAHFASELLTLMITDGEWRIGIFYTELPHDEQDGLPF